VDGRVPRPLDIVAAYSWRIVVIAAALAVAIYLISVVDLVAITVALSLIVARALSPPVNWLSGRGAPRLLATWVVFLVIVAVFVGLGWFIGPQFVDELSQLDDTLLESVERLRDWLVEGPFGLEERQIDDLIDRGIAEVQQRGDLIWTGIVGGTLFVVEVAAGLILTLVIAFYFVKDGPRLWGKISGLAPLHRRTFVRDVGRRSWSVFGGYLLGSVIEGAVEATALAIALTILGVPLVLPLAVLAFFAAFVPYLGPLIAGGLAALLALVSGGLVAAVVVVIVFIIIQQIESNIVSPWVMGITVHLHPVVVLLSITAGAILAGLIGVLLAVPIAGVTAAIISLVREEGEATPPDTYGAAASEAAPGG
jgi:predicted PurR-regulated permease PerM